MNGFGNKVLFPFQSTELFAIQSEKEQLKFYCKKKKKQNKTKSNKKQAQQMQT